MALTMAVIISTITSIANIKSLIAIGILDNTKPITNKVIIVFAHIFI